MSARSSDVHPARCGRGGLEPICRPYAANTSINVAAS